MVNKKNRQYDFVIINKLFLSQQNRVIYKIKLLIMQLK